MSLTLLWNLTLIVLLASCAQAEVATPRPVAVEIAGATSMHPVLEELAAAFTERHPGVLIELRGGGSALGETRVSERRSELAASTLMEETTPGASVADTGVELVRAPIGIDGISVIVHDNNPVTGFTTQQLRDLFSGRILDWQDMGGNPGEIALVSREDGSGTRRAFESRIMGDSPVSLTAVVMPTSRDVVEYVSKNPFAIGYVSSAYTSIPNKQTEPTAAADEIPAASAIRVLAIDGVLPSDKTIINQSYPLIQPLYLVTGATPQGWAQQFIDFALSPAGQAIVDRYHVPVR